MAVKLFPDLETKKTCQSKNSIKKFRSLCWSVLTFPDNSEYFIHFLMLQIYRKIKNTNTTFEYTFLLKNVINGTIQITEKKENI